MVFNTSNGRDYLRQLHALGAMLAIPGPDGGYLVIRDLLKRPVQPMPEDLAGMDKIYWIDDKSGSVASLSAAMGLQPPPSHVAAFFPKELEQRLLALETKQLPRGRTEDDIEETRFEVRRDGQTYIPVITAQRLKR